jgi:hypothetical protein
MKNDQAFVSQAGIFIETVRQPAASMINGAPRTVQEPSQNRANSGFANPCLASRVIPARND